MTIRDAETERWLLSDECMKMLAPYSILRRVRFLHQKYGIECSINRLRTFYLKNNITFRNTTKSWKISEGELHNVNVLRHDYAQRIQNIKTNDQPIVYFDECTMVSF